MDLPGEKCAVFAVFGRGLEVSRLSFFGLFSLQHRGQESSGIATADGEIIRVHKSAGLVASVYSEENIRGLVGHIAIGHNRYSTSLGTGNHHAQPIIEENFAFAHNGNLPSVRALKAFFSKKDIDVSGLNDSELMARAISYYFKNGVPIEEAVRSALPLFTGAYCLVIMTKDALVAVRDECGIRPLAIGQINGGYVFASESCAFKTIGAEFMREIAPGEMIVVDALGMRPFQVLPQNPKLDIFEFVYFARPDSNILGKSVYEVRRNLGVRLAKEFPLDADIVVPVPDTAIPSAIGYANTLGIPFEMALVKNRYIHRTFIEPDQHSRDLGVKMKLSPLPEVLNGKRVVVIDDSIVRGTTSRQIVKTLFEAGAKEVHFLVCSPPIQYPDFYGIDISEQTKLIAFHKTVEEIREYLGATSLYYLSLNGMVKATGLPEEIFSLSCFNGKYPIALHERVNDFEQSKVVEPAAGTLFGE